jgi:3-oxoacyl-[acyl-carrier protein] reductase
MSGLNNRIALVTGGSRGIGIAADVSVANGVLSMISSVEEHLGPIDVLVNNAGIATTRGLDDITEEDFDRSMAVNLKSAFLCTQAVLPGMRARRWGRIINISSIGARLGAGSVSVAYGAAKAGLEGLTRAYALRLASDGVTVNAVAPGLIDTEMGKPLIEAGVAARIPVGRVGTGDEIAQAVLLLVSDAYITGQTLAVNGGSLFS